MNGASSKKLLICLVASLFVGATIGFLVGFNLQTSGGASGTQTARIDNDQDGQIDAEYTYEKSDLTSARYDRNVDGAWDYWEWFEHSRILRAEEDNNFDGMVDGWLDYEHGYLLESRHDIDKNQIIDIGNRYRHGVILFSMGRPNGETNNAWVEFYREGRLWKEFRDKDGDGLLERLKVYGWFGDVEHEEVLAPALAPTHVQP